MFSQYYDFLINFLLLLIDDLMLLGYKIEKHQHSILC